MDKLSTAAALSGWSQNRNVGRNERDQAAEQAFQIYESVANGLKELLSYLDAQAQHSGYALEEDSYRDAADKLRAILDGE